MPRVKRGTVRRAKRKKLLARAKGFYQTKSKLYRAAKESVDTALKYAFVGRKSKKRDFRRLWIVRINAAARENGLTYTRSCAASRRQASRSTARCSPTSPSREPQAFAALAAKARDARCQPRLRPDRPMVDAAAIEALGDAFAARPGRSGGSDAI